MARRVFFSFHYQEDIWRVNQVRNSWVVQKEENKKYNTRLFWDSSLWEEVKKKGDSAIKSAINEGLQGTSVTVVLIGAHTYQRKYVKYEMGRSEARGNGLLGVYIGNLPDQGGNTSTNGPNPFHYVSLDKTYPTYYWYGNNGYENFADWVEAAAVAAGH